MIDLLDMLHYAIGMLILALMLWAILIVHNYFSRNNLELITNKHKVP